MNFIFSFLISLFMADSHDLRLNLKVGESYMHTYKAVSDIRQELGGMEQTVGMTINLAMKFDVKDLKEDVYYMKASYTDISMSVVSDVPGVSMSSDDEGFMGDIFRKVFGEMSNKEFDLWLKTDGTVKEVRGVEKIFDTVFDAFPDFPEAQKDAMLAEFDKNFGDQSFVGNVEMVTSIYPPNAVNIGDTWTTRNYLRSSMHAKLENTFTLEEVTDEYISISAITKINTDLDSITVVNGLQTRYQLDGSMTSTFKVDPETLWILEAEINQDFGGWIEFMESPQMPEMKVPMDVKQSYSISGN